MTGGTAGHEPHAEPLPWYAPPPDTHTAWVTTLHDAKKQHAPVGGCGHTIEPHWLPLPWYTPPDAVHPVAVDVMHAPVAVIQQAPVGPPPIVYVNCMREAVVGDSAAGNRVVE
jgi:hypothetical protein